MIRKLTRSPLATNVIRLRNSKKWSQAELAHRVGVHVNTIKSIETSQNEGTFDTRAAIAETLGVQFSELYIEPNPSRQEPGWPELSRALQGYLEASPERRLLSLYILTDDERYLSQYEATPDAPPIAGVLKKIL